MLTKAGFLPACRLCNFSYAVIRGLTSRTWGMPVHQSGKLPTGGSGESTISGLLSNGHVGGEAVFVAQFASLTWSIYKEPG